MTRLAWVRVPETVAGQVLAATLDPATRRLAVARRVLRATPHHLRLVAITVESIEPHPQPTDPTWNVTYRLRVLHEGRLLRIDLGSGTYLTVLEPHHPVCGECGEVWPCRDVRLERAAGELFARLEDTCAHCGQPIGAADAETFDDGLATRRYHTALRYRGPDGVRCRMALAAARTSVPGAPA